MAIEFGPKDRYRTYGIPSLDLPFADRKSLVDRISGNNLITFTRSTTGTYVGSDGLIKTAAVNEARFDHNPLTRESLGLLVEEARTNYLFAYASPNYNTSPAAVYSTYSDSRFGAAENAHSWTWPSAANAIELGWFNPGSVSTTGNGVQYTISFWAKASQAYTMNGGIDDERRQGVTFATSLTTSWQYFSFSTPAGIADDGAGVVYFRWLRSGFNHAIPAGLRIDFAAVNLERGGFPTSYIPTSGSAVTRAADVVSMNANPYLYGTFFAKYKHQPGNANYRQIFSIGGSTAYSAFVCRTTTTLNGVVNIVLPGTLDLTSTVNTESSQFNSVATTRVVGDYALSLNGGTVVTSNSSADNTNNAVITFMYGSTGAISGGHIARFTYYPNRLPNATLQAITST